MIKWGAGQSNPARKATVEKNTKTVKQQKMGDIPISHFQF
ncbi:hypothetical protein JOC34_002519 [Virgibacillus halotolerans]|nr:hypothetical protein [Virgibacillus halotolerans]